MIKNKTVQVRINKELRDTLHKRFPDVSTADIIQMMYNTSALRLEGVLKEKNVKNKMGKFIFGKQWKED